MAPLVQLDDQTEKRIGLVYNSESGLYQALDFSKLDSIEDILNSDNGEKLDNFLFLSVI